MGVPNPFKGSRAEWLNENGWRHEVTASSGRWELRVYPEQRPPLVLIADRSSFLPAVASVKREGALWRVDGVTEPVPAHEPFADPVAAFRWWSTNV